MIGGDQGVENEAVEWIVDLGDPRQGRRSAVGGEHLTERGDGVRRQRVARMHKIVTDRIYSIQRVSLQMILRRSLD
jgi:hypothetical protein